jgi:hypothetical protein
MEEAGSDLIQEFKERYLLKQEPLGCRGAPSFESILIPFSISKPLLADS